MAATEMKVILWSEKSQAEFDAAKEEQDTLTLKAREIASMSDGLPLRLTGITKSLNMPPAAICSQCKGSHFYEILLDGVKQELCVFADVTNGFVIVRGKRKGTLGLKPTLKEGKVEIRRIA